MTDDGCHAEQRRLPAERAIPFMDILGGATGAVLQSEVYYDGLRRQ